MSTSTLVIGSISHGHLRLVLPNRTVVIDLPEWRRQREARLVVTAGEPKGAA